MDGMMMNDKDGRKIFFFPIQLKRVLSANAKCANNNTQHRSKNEIAGVKVHMKVQIMVTTSDTML
jgi:hypothetical protein